MRTALVVIVFIYYKSFSSSSDHFFIFGKRPVCNLVSVVIRDVENIGG